MAPYLSTTLPNPLLSPFPDRTRPRQDPAFHRTPHFPAQKTLLRGSLCVARFGFQLPDPDSSEALVRDLFGRVESIFYTIADAAVANSDTVTDVTTKQNSNNDWFSGITYAMESVLKVLQDGLSTLHVPYAYGFAIILLTVIVKAATFPLTKKQVESAMAMRSLNPQIKAIQERYKGDPLTAAQEKLQLETARLYKVAGINPFSGCLPTLATIPIWIGLYRALSNVADEGLLTEGFFWIPSLAGPTTIAARQSGSGISWLFPFVDGHPPLGWSDTLAYLVLPVLLVLSQYISIQIMQPAQSDDPNMKNSQAITKFLPLLVGYFSLSVPSGLSLYWLTNNILSTGQQVWLQKLGGAENPVRPFKDDIVKEDQPQIVEPVSELNSIKTEVVERETSKSEGPRPGERFKQLKEQEARRKQLTEQEKTRAEEASDKRNEESDEVLKNEANSFEGENGTSPLSVANVADEKSATTGHNSSTVGLGVNGDSSDLEPSNDEKATSGFSTETSDVSFSGKAPGRDE
ncbi:ALBINO3-like protein 1, chloroplastic [Turnera subulata]|uniref:ALBINO3-like protein 1, chloroplastic n=1 Tax=Turnera subulata TaxID=218843 RepID=A0A9Q0GH90_9ROSI|nr:ALBINO3-like protein 1, chloroplastic [Turnera subulata]